MNKLPSEILERIFSYLDVEDLVQAQNVSITWNEICQSDYVWKNAVYAPSKSVSCTQIESILKHAPKIKEFLPSNTCPCAYLYNVNKYCPQLRKLRIIAEQMNHSELSHYFHINGSIEELEVVITLFHPMQLGFLEQCFTLRSLKLQGRIDTSKCNFMMMAKFCPFLKNLDVQYLKGYKIQELYTIVTICALESLKVTIWNNTLPWLDIFDCSDNMKSLTIDHSRTNISRFDSFRLAPSVIDITFICPKAEVESFLIPLLMGRYFINLQRFELVGCHFSRTLANAVFRECPNLKTLKFSKSTDLTDGTLVFIRDLVHLQSLTLADCNEITDKAMKFISLCPNLRALYLLNCALLTDKAPELMKSLKRLSRLVFEPSNPVDTPNST